ncbi:MAG: hypothetical protein E7514_07980 [Ruminococcaceae bacterium]|nr:hypothetical protein [Oscillospiraceae bacterium]
MITLKQVNKILDAVGRSVFVYSNNRRSSVYKATIQPLRYKNKMYLNGEVNEIGHYGEGYYLYIGPAEISLDNLDEWSSIVTLDGIYYKIERSERVYFRDETVYTWAVLKERI